MLPTLAILATVAHAEDDEVVKAAKQTTKVAVRKTKQGTRATVRAVSSAAEWALPEASLKPTPETIAKARKAGKVWADHQDWVYYKDGPQYGHTETGEFWTEEGAKSAGYKLAENK
ncbi:MAG: hypothetical protein WDN31_11185 [Hyphomicrobium sp.]